MAESQHSIGAVTRRNLRAQADLLYPGTKAWSVWLQEFWEYVHPGAANEEGWIETVVDTDTDSGNTQALDDTEPHGVLKLVTDDNALDSIQIQWHNEMAQLLDDKDLFFECRVKIDDATQSNLRVGLAVLDTTILAGVSDWVGFDKDDGNDNIDAVVAKDTSNTDDDDTGEDLVDDTYVRLGFYWHGTGKVLQYYVNGVKQAMHNTVANIPQNEVLAPFLAYKNGQAAASTIHIDYMLVAQER